MPFFADNDRIHITDVNGETVFDTETDMPHIVQIYEGRLTHTWDSLSTYYYYDGYYPVCTPDGGHDVTCYTAGPTTTVMGSAGYEYESPRAITELNDDIDFLITRATLVSRGQSSSSWLGGWLNTLMEGTFYWQGSSLLEQGHASNGKLYCNRLLHIYPNNDWRALVASFHQSSVETILATTDVSTSPTLTTNGTVSLDIKCWMGRFR